MTAPKSMQDLALISSPSEIMDPLTLTQMLWEVTVRNKDFANVKSGFIPTSNC